MTAQPTLLYFDIRGRAQPIRMLLSYLNVDFSDRQVTMQEWESVRSTTPFKRMPVYTDADAEIPESFAIMNYLGRKYDLCGHSAAERIRCDVTTEAWRDYGNRIANVFGALSESEEARQRFLKEEQPVLLADLEKYYLENEARASYWAGDSLTICDFVAFHSIDGVMRQFPSLLGSYGALERFHEFFAALPGIQAYLESPRRPAALFYGPKGKIYPRD